MKLTSQVIITSQVRSTLNTLLATRENERVVVICTSQLKEEVECPSNLRPDECKVIVTEKQTFAVADAKLAIEKAHMASEIETVILLIAKEFPPLIQNKLLKVIEEPPPRVSFILITASRATILPTIRSRMPVLVLKDTDEGDVFELDMGELDLRSVYEFIQKQRRLTDKAVAKTLVERISSEAINSQSFDLDERTLQLFYDAFRALDVGSQPQFVLMTLLLKLLARKKR